MLDSRPMMNINISHRCQLLRRDAHRKELLELGGADGSRDTGCEGTAEMRIMEPKFQSNKLLRTLASCLWVAVFGALAGWATTQGLLIKSLFIGMAALLALPLFSQNRPITIVSLQKGLLYLVIIAGFIGPALLAIGVGPIHLFPYRILLPLLWMVFAISVLFNQGRVGVSHMKVKSYLQ